MEVLEIKPIRNKEIRVYLIKLSNIKSKPNAKVNLIEFLTRININFATVDLENENLRNFNKSSLAKTLEQYNIPYYLVNIPEYAMGYLMTEIREKEEQVDELEQEFLRMKDKGSIKGLNLKSWIDFLKEEIDEKRLFLQSKLRPEWITKKILDIIRAKDNNEITFVHFAQDNIFNEMMNLLKDLDIEVEIFDQKKEKLALNLIIKEEELEQWKY
jgi:glutaredoxin